MSFKFEHGNSSKKTKTKSDSPDEPINKYDTMIEHNISNTNNMDTQINQKSYFEKPKMKNNGSNKKTYKKPLPKPVKYFVCDTVVLHENTIVLPLILG